jgi:ferredoxin-thioredoxin reductase catalytic subunit/rubredoxin
MANDKSTVSPGGISSRYEELKRDAGAGGYYLNPDLEFTRELVEGLMINKQRYGYEACPCRLASGDEQQDLDIICPCVYRDPDLSEYGTCYCGLYVSETVLRGEKTIGRIPERRPPDEERAKVKAQTSGSLPDRLTYPVWRCKVCGYLCAREHPPEVCPVCKAKKERFEKFLT